MSKQNDSNFGFVGGANGFEEWACDDFNLLAYVGNDNAPFDLGKDHHDEFDLPEEDESLRKKDMLYSALQYNNVLLNNEQTTDISLYDDQQSRMPSLSIDDELVSQENPMLPSTSKATPALSKMIKLEMDTAVDYYDDRLTNNTVTSDSSLSPYASKMKPRKYRIKPENEKRNPQYRAKREKNNDAVRRSRDKAKRLQEQKDERLHFLENENVRQKKVIEQLQNRNNFLEKQLINLKRNCRCRINQ